MEIDKAGSIYKMNWSFFNPYIVEFQLSMFILQSNWIVSCKLQLNQLDSLKPGRIPLNTHNVDGLNGTFAGSYCVQTSHKIFSWMKLSIELIVLLEAVFCLGIIKLQFEFNRKKL